jgi:hypothetical protein
MNDISQIRERIVLAHAAIGSTKLHRLSGVPYRTVVNASRRGFRSMNLRNFERLADAVAGEAWIGSRK